MEKTTDKVMVLVWSKCEVSHDTRGMFTALLQIETFSDVPDECVNYCSIKFLFRRFNKYFHIRSISRERFFNPRLTQFTVEACSPSAEELTNKKLFMKFLLDNETYANYTLLEM